MNYRFQEILKLVVPGFLLLILIFIFNRAYQVNYTGEVALLAERIGKVPNSILLLTLPFIAFLIGYGINMVSSFCERNLYRLGLRRPSYILLNNGTFSKQERINLVSLINHPDANNICKKQAGQIFKAVKERHRTGAVVDEMYYQSILARNILGADFLAFAYATCHVCFTEAEFKEFPLMWTVAVFVLVCLYKQWRRANKVYMRRLIKEYLASKRTS